MSVVDSVAILKRRPLTDEEYLKAAVLGWCIEFVGHVPTTTSNSTQLSQLQAYFLVADDMMDASITRRGQPCWYRNPNVGMIAINDSFMLCSAIYRLLKSYFRNEPYYVDLLEVFLETTWQTEIGQLIDLITAPEQVNLDKFSLERFVSLTIRSPALTDIP